MNILEQLNILLMEAEGISKTKESDIPIHPEMETREQGEMSAAEKILKLFQKLKAGSGGGREEIKDEKPEIPDDIIDPMMKESPKASKEKTFEKNKLAGWDEKSDEKIKKEVDVDNGNNDDDEFDDFDYKKNSFGDEDDEDEMQDYDDDDRSEDEKLKDSIDNAIDSLNGDKNDDDDDEFEGDDSGSNWGEDEEEYGEGGEGEGGEGGEGRPEGGEGKSQGGTQQGGTPQDTQQGGKGSERTLTKDGNKRETMSQKQKRLEDLKKSLDSKDLEKFDEKMQEIKDSTDLPDDDETPGGQIETPSDETFKKDMKKAGFDEKTIDEMTEKKNTDTKEDYNEEEMEKLKKDVVKGLEDACSKKKGGSQLATTIVKNSLKRKIDNEEWRELLKMFLKGKSIGKGKHSTTNKGTKWGSKNHLWRDAILPTSAPSKGTIQNIYCFIDFSGSVDQDLVFTFLGKVIDLCVTLKYTEIKVYAFGERIVEPYTLNKKTLNNGPKVALSDAWEFIDTQVPGGGTENFSDVAKEINKIKRKEKDAVCLIFGDAYWGDYFVGPKCLKYEIANKKYLDDICVLAYYKYTGDTTFAGMINLLKSDLVGIKHIITTKASSIHD